jgi:hypothetical protein
MEALRAVNPLRVGDVTLVPIERVWIRSDRGDAGYWISAFKEAFAIVVCDANGVRALDPDSSEIPLDALIRKTPNLGAILSEISAS